ncbi:MAG: Fic family protein, partial [Candidatus Margulisiibacteriota bacterium]
RTLSVKRVLELHHLLITNLGVDTGFRNRIVKITGSNYVPCDNKFQIEEFFNNIIEKINSTESILSKAIMANLLIAYLQPFEDGNKRTSRMLGNAILLANKGIPVSFSHTPKEDYIKALLYFYEKQDPAFFKYLFLKELEQSFREYAA